MAHEGTAHYWIIDTPQGKTSLGYCQIEGCEDSPREFVNVIMREDLFQHQHTSRKGKRDDSEGGE